MKNILTYLKDYGKYGFDELAFHETDSLILSQLSYLKFDGMVPGMHKVGTSASLRALFVHPDRENLFVKDRYEENNRYLFEHAAFSKRFQNTKLRLFESFLDTVAETQFAAVLFELEKGPVYIAFRGTDETLVGWKEDFNMAFQAPVPAQEAGVRYLNAAAGRIKTPSFYVGGHSKGGNIAVYAAMMCKPKIRERLRAVYNFDGPGFTEALDQSEAYNAVKDRIVKLAPESSFIGMLFQTGEDYKVVASAGKEGITQHDPFNWIVDGINFQYLDAVSRKSQRVNQRINHWIADLNESQRQLFVDTLYQVLRATEAQTLMDLSEDWKDNAIKMANAFHDVDQETKKMIRQVIRSLFVMSHRKNDKEE